MENVLKSGEYTMHRLTELKAEFPGLIKDIRTIGLISAIEFYELKAKDIAVKLTENGFLTTAVQDRVLRLTPPLTIKENEIDLLFLSISEILNDSK